MSALPRAAERLRVPSRGDAPPRGFTLLEVLVALAIAGLALVGLFEAGSAGLFATDTAARTEEAVERAQSRLAAVGAAVALARGDASGRDGGGYRWHIRIRPIDSRSRHSGRGDFGPIVKTTLYQIEVAESWREGGRKRQVVLRSLRISGPLGRQ